MLNKYFFTLIIFSILAPFFLANASPFLDDGEPKIMDKNDESESLIDFFDIFKSSDFEKNVSFSNESALKVMKQLLNLISSTSDIDESKHRSRKEYDIALIPSYEKYHIICKRKRDKSWGRTYKVIIDPWNEDEDPWQYTIVVPFDQPKDDHDHKFEENTDLFSTSVSIDSSPGLKLFEKLFSIGNLKSTLDHHHHHHHNREYEIAVLPSYRKYRIIVDREQNLFKDKGHTWRVTVISESHEFKPKSFIIVVPYEDGREKIVEEQFII
ncbi:hypothetical protein G9A89_016925 [Geosiphon pyriformis]|nr:hypothetical protein G9A89_016925 [Geosiphon pyriformis]